MGRDGAGRSARRAHRLALDGDAATRGRRRLQLLVAARTVGRDGSAFDAAPPDRVIDVVVRGNPLRRAMRWIALLAVLAVAGAVGRYGQELWEVGPTALFNRLIETITGLLAASGFMGG